MDTWMIWVLIVLLLVLVGVFIFLRIAGKRED